MKVIRMTPGLGNQMFQYAFILNYKLKGEEIFVDLSPCKYAKKHNSYEVEKIFNIKVKEATFWQKFKLIGPSIYIGSREVTFLKVINKIIEKMFGEKYIINSKDYFFDNIANCENNFDPKYLELKGNKYIAGYFNSWKYFENVQDEVRKVFTFPEILEVDRQNFEILNKIKNTESISIHVRRGDYIGSNLDVCDLDYYKRSFEFIIKELEKRNIKSEYISFYIFSDDIDWCRSNFEFLKEYNTMYVDWNKSQNNYKDIQLMSKCKHNIIPNSTFSWWSAWLNENTNKVVIAPKYWFKEILTSNDRLLNNWIKM